MNLKSTIRRSSRAAIVLLVCAVLPAALTRCGAAVDGEYGTETGNPPVIQRAKLRLVVNGDELRLIGDPGALPPSASVRVTNQRTGVVLDTTAEDDGSLDVSVDGERTDTFELAVVTTGGEASVTLSATELPLDSSTLSCDGLRDAKDDAVAEVFAEADQTCATDRDCRSEVWETFCYSRCAEVVASRDGFDAADRAAEDRVNALCEQEQRSGCTVPPPALCGSTSAALCDDNRCVIHERAELDCRQRGRVALAQRELIVERADRECQVDADCSLIAGDGLCLPVCNFVRSVSVSASSSVQAEVDQLESSACIELDGCSDSDTFANCSEPSGTTRPACVQGQCTTSFEPSQED
ncbi:MAG: hypothetical protein ABW217_06940 [Polyangiaceae bacterium]